MKPHCCYFWFHRPTPTVLSPLSSPLHSESSPFITLHSFFENIHVNFFFLTQHNNGSIGSSRKIFTYFIFSFLHLHSIIYLAYCWTAALFLLNKNVILKCNHPFFSNKIIYAKFGQMVRTFGSMKGTTQNHYGCC